MNWRKKLLKSSKLYVLIDKDICLEQIIKIAKVVISSRVDIIQLRYKHGLISEVLRCARILRKLSQGKCLFIVNDYVDVALACQADGLHIGQDDIPIEIARKILGKEMLIGVSCHNLRQAKIAQEKGADYIGIGPIFSTASKPQAHPIGPEILPQIKKNIRIPFFPIGGINQENIEKLLNLDIKRLAIASAICKSNNLRKKINGFKALLD